MPPKQSNMINDADRARKSRAAPAFDSPHVVWQRKFRVPAFRVRVWNDAMPQARRTVGIWSNIKSFSGLVHTVPNAAIERGVRALPI